MKLRDLWYYLKFNYKKVVLFVVPTAFLLVLLVVAVNYLQTKRQAPTKSSASGTVALSFDSAGKSVALNTNFSTKVRVDPVGSGVTAIELHLAFDKTKINLVSIAASSSFSNVLIQPVINNTAGTAVVVLGVPVPPATPVTVASDLVTVNAKTLGVSGSTQISVASSTVVAAVGSTTNVAGTFGSITVTIPAPPTATPTTTPTATATPTATPTTPPGGPTVTPTPTAPPGGPTATPTATPTGGPKFGDVNGDGLVNLIDIQWITDRYTTELDDPKYDPKCDLGGSSTGGPDGLCNIVDIQIVIDHWYNP